MPKHAIRVGCTLLAMAAIWALPLAAAAQPPKAPRPQVSVSASASVSQKPDQVTLNFGVRTQALKAKQAVTQNAVIMARVLKALKAKKQPGDIIRTQGYRLSPDYQYDRTARASKLVGYKATNQVIMITGQVKAAGELIDLASRAGANQISGPVWSLKDSLDPVIKAQKMAFARAKAQAKALARAAGMILGPVIGINTSGSPNPSMRAPAPMLAARAASAPPTQVVAGLIEVRASVSCRFGLRAK